MARSISPHFTYDEMTTTSTGLANVPNSAAIASLVALAENVLEPWRALVGPLTINSGYRSPAVNEAVKGSRTSDHMLGRAADVKPVSDDEDALGDAWVALVGAVRTGALPVDQAILYVRPEGHGWIHVSHRPSNRRELLVDVNGKYLPWATYAGPLVLG